MNVFQLLHIATLIMGTLLFIFHGFRYGYQNFGITGALVAIPIGILCGYILPYIFLFILAVFLKIWLGGPLFPPKRQKNENIKSNHST